MKRDEEINITLARYREQVRKLFIKTLKDVPKGTLEERRVDFYHQLQIAHWELVQGFPDIYQDWLSWGEFDGTAILTYQPYYTLKKTEFKFTYPSGVIN